MKEVIDVKISSGTLRKKYNEALKTYIVCQNALLMVLASMNHDPTYTNEDKLYIENALIRHNCTKEYIDMVVPQISAKYCPAKHQIDEMLSVLSGTYTFNRYYIEDSRLKSVDWNTIPGKQKKLGLNEKAKAIKQYIYENDKVELVLEAMGCSILRYHAPKHYWICSNPGGDRVDAVNVYNAPYLHVENRSKGYNCDFIEFIKRCLSISFKETLEFLSEVLELADDNPALAAAYHDYSEGMLESSTEVESEEEKPITYVDENILKQYCPLLHIDWYRDSIMPWTREKFDLRYDYDTNRVVIPLRHHETGGLMGVNSRTTVADYDLLGISKYWLTPGYQRNQNLYGLWENKKAILENDFVIVFEGCRSVLKLDTLYQRSKDKKDRSIGVAILGKYLSEKQVQILLDLKVNIIISLDKDQRIEDVRHQCSQFWGHTNKKIYYTYDCDGLLDSKDAAIDKGKKIFEAIMIKAVLFDEQEYKKYQADLRNK